MLLCITPCMYTVKIHFIWIMLHTYYTLLLLCSICYLLGIKLLAWKPFKGYITQYKWSCTRFYKIGPRLCFPFNFCHIFPTKKSKLYSNLDMLIQMWISRVSFTTLLYAFKSGKYFEKYSCQIQTPSPWLAKEFFY